MSLRDKFLALLEEEEEEKEIEIPKPKPKPRPRKKEPEVIKPKDWATEVYRAFYLIISGHTIRGSKDRALKALIKLLATKLKDEIGEEETRAFLSELASKV